MVGRILRLALFAALAVIIIKRLFSRGQKQALHETVTLAAWVFVAATVLAWLWYAFAGD